jgi:hypothetical protein
MMGESGLVTILIFHVHGGRRLAILQSFLDGLAGELPFLKVLDHSPTVDQVVGLAFIGALEVLKGLRPRHRC